MTKNEVSLLQEYVVKKSNSDSTPIYNYFEVDTQEPEKFYCVVSFSLDDKTYQFNSELQRSKKKAKIESALHALIFFEKKEQENNTLTESENNNEPKEKRKRKQNRSKNKNKLSKYSLGFSIKNITVFIDYENYTDDKEIDEFKKSVDAKVLKISSRYHQKADSADLCIDSARKDAADIFIVCQVAELMKKSGKGFAFIVSKDKFASVVPDIYPKRCYHVSDIKHCYEIIKKNFTPEK